MIQRLITSIVIGQLAISLHALTPQSSATAWPGLGGLKYPPQHYYDGYGIAPVGSLAPIPKSVKDARAKIHSTAVTVDAQVQMIKNSKYDLDIGQAAVYKCYKDGKIDALATALAKIPRPLRDVAGYDREMEQRQSILYLYCYSYVSSKIQSHSMKFTESEHFLETNFPTDDRGSFMLAFTWHRMMRWRLVRPLIRSRLSDRPQFYQLRLIYAKDLGGGALYKVERGKEVPVPKDEQLDRAGQWIHAKRVLKDAPNWDPGLFYCGQIAMSNDKAVARQCFKKLIAKWKPSHPWYSTVVQMLESIENDR